MKKDEILVIAVFILGATVAGITESALPMILAFLGVGFIVLKEIFKMPQAGVMKGDKKKPQK
jgi:hypothetical protein